MTHNKMLVTVGMLALAMGVGPLSADAAQRGDHGNRGDRGGRETRQENGPRGQGRAERGPEARRDDRRADRDDRRGDRDDRRPRGGQVYRYEAPRPAPRVYAPARPYVYGPRNRFDLYFGWGSGYRYGSLYNGRVYGYRAPAPAYGSYVYYGDVRLQVRPRDAAVYVDGYYAGVVDNFDGVFQRLTLEVGPHRIELEAPGFEPQTYDINVDPTRTIDVRSDLRPDRPY